MHASAHAFATYADIEALPRHVTGQIIDGELFVSPRPALSHAETCSRLFHRLMRAFDHREGDLGGWTLLFEPELHLDDDILVPDIAGWQRGRLTNLRTAATTVAPDWVCEVLSPSTAGVDRIRKLPRYGEAGVRWVWFVDPLGESIEVFEWQDGRWVVHGGWGEDDKCKAAPFDALELTLATLWPRPLQPSSGAAEPAPEASPAE